MKTLTTKAAAAAVGVALVAGAGIALALDDVTTPGPVALSAGPGASETTADEPTADEPTAEEPTAPTSIDEAEARRLAVEAVGSGEAVRIQADRDDGRPEWEVLVRDGDGRLLEVTLNATDGRVREIDLEDDDEDDHEHRRPVASVTVEEAQAGELAVAAVGGGEMLRVRPDEDDGRPEWEVDVTDADGRLVEVTIDATNGDVLKVDVQG